MDEATVDKVLDRLDQLGEISVQGFEILARQAVAEALKYSIWALIWFIVAIIFARIASKTYKGELFQDIYTFTDSYSGRQTSYNKQWSIPYGIVSITTLLVGLYHAGQALLRFINPKFYAIEYILRSL